MSDLILFICFLIIMRGVWLFVIKPHVEPLSDDDLERLAEARRIREMYNDNTLNS